MMTKNKRVVLLISLLLCLVLSVTLLTPGLSAEAGDAAADDAAVLAGAEAENDDAAEEPGDEDGEAEAEVEVEETTPGTSAGDEEEAGGLGISFWISMGVLAVLVVIAVAVGIKKRESLGKWWRSYKSELKKIVWMPWNDVRKNTLVVIVVVVVIGALIGLLDYVFSRGIIELGNIIPL